MNAWLITVLLALMVGQPAPKQQSNPQKHQEEGKQRPAPSAISPAVATPPSQPTPDIKQDGAKNKPNNWFEWFWQPLLSNWPLVAVGVAGIWAALRTLGAIKRQADILERQTNATETAANADPVRDGDFLELRPTPLAVEWAPMEITVDCHCENNRASEMTMIIYGFVKYRDVFSPERRTYFGYSFDPNHRLERLSSSEYNKNT